MMTERAEVAPAPARNRSLDALRGVAILLVLGSHFPYYQPWFRIGWLGVNLFFVLSGFLVSGLLFTSLRETGSLGIRRFIIRRGFKIWPSFYLYLIAAAAYSLLIHPYPWRQIIYSGLFVINYTESGALFGHLWSLCVEEHFYLLLPAVLWILHRFRSFSLIPWLSIGLLMLCLFLRFLKLSDALHLGTQYLVDQLYLGVGLSYLYYFAPPWFRRFSGHPSLFLGILLAAPPAFFRQTVPVQTIGLTAIAVGCGLILAWCVTRTLPPWLGWLARIGFYSYPIYLWHVVVRFVIPGNFGSGFFGFWTYILSAVVIGVMMSQNTERPFLKIRDRLFPEPYRRASAPHS